MRQELIKMLSRVPPDLCGMQLRYGIEHKITDTQVLRHAYYRNAELYFFLVTFFHFIVTLSEHLIHLFVLIPFSFILSKSHRAGIDVAGNREEFLFAARSASFYDNLPNNR